MEEHKFAPALPSDSRFAVAQTPRLSILHLMLWTLCSALHLTAYQAILSLQGRAPPGLGGVQEASAAINGIVSGAVFAGAIVLLGTRLRSGPPMLRQPGHWLLVAAALQTLVYLPVVACLLLMQQLGHTRNWFLLYYAAVMVISPLVYGFAVSRQRALRWRILFLLLLAASGAQCLAYVALGISSNGPRSWVMAWFAMQGWAGPLLAAGVVVMSIGELVSGQRRDWLHWTGIATYAGAMLAGLLWTVAIWFLR